MTGSDAAVSLALIGLLSWVLKDMTKKITRSIDNQTKESSLTRKAISENTKFMKNLNGELKRATQKKLGAE